MEERLKLTPEQLSVFYRFKGILTEMRANNIGIVVTVDGGLGLPEISVFNKKDVKHAESTEFGSNGDTIVSTSNIRGTVILADVVIKNDDAEVNFTFKKDNADPA